MSARRGRTTAVSVVLVTGASGAVKVLEAVGLIVLARLLAPEDFGAVGLALVVISLLNLFAQAGMGSAVVQTDADARKAAFNAFLVTAGVGGLLTAAAATAAGPIARLLGHPELASVLTAMAFLIPLQMATVVPTSLMLRDLRFGRQAATLLVGAVVRLVTSIVAALAGFGLWSLVIGYLAGAAGNAGASMWLCTTRRWLRVRHWDPRLAAALARFGAPVMGTGFVRQFYNNLDDLVMGSTFGVAALGYYRNAYRVANLPVDGLSHAVNSVLLPTFSRIKHDPQRMGTAFLSAFRVMAVIVVPVGAVLVVLASEGIRVVLGPAWEPAAPMLQALAAVAVIRPLSGLTGPVNTASGRPGHNLRTAVLQGVSLLVLIALVGRMGPVWLAGCVSATFLLGFLHNLRFVVRSGTVAWSDLWRVLAPPAAAGAAAIGIGAAAHAALARVVDPATLPGLALSATAVGVAYLVVLALLDRTGLVELAHLARTLVTRRRRRTTHTAAPPDPAHESALRAWQPTLPAKPVDRWEHLSGWKHHGAYRLRLRDWDPATVVWKQGRYEPEALPALVGLPVAPGPPEFVVYRRPRRLAQYLPAVHGAEEVVPGQQYRYVLEDLAPTHQRVRQPALGLAVARVLPAVHAALSADLPVDDPRLIHYLGGSATALLDYTLSALESLRRTADMAALEHVWQCRRRLVDRYERGLAAAADVAGPTLVHGDLNPTNVWQAHRDPGSLRLVDWEWAGFGFAHADLVAACKRTSPDAEAAALRIYHQAAGERSLGDDALVYAWCRLQRYVLDAGFIARQHLGGTSGGVMDFERHLTGSLEQILTSVDRLDDRLGLRTPL